MLVQTSIQAYHEIKPTLGKRQKEILALFKENTALTDQEISRILRKPINCITPRRGELVKLGLVVRMAVVKSQYTNKNVSLWSLK